MTIKFALLLFFLAITSFVLTELLDELMFSMLAEYTAQFGSMALLCGFLVLLITYLVLVTKSIVAVLGHYFSVQQRMYRKLIFFNNHINILNQIYFFKKKRLLYAFEQERKNICLTSDVKPIKPNSHGKPINKSN